MASKRRHRSAVGHQALGQGSAFCRGALKKRVLQHQRREAVLPEAHRVAAEGCGQSGTLPGETVGQDCLGNHVPVLVAAQSRPIPRHELVRQLHDPRLPGSVLQQRADHTTTAWIQCRGAAMPEQLGRDAFGGGLARDVDGLLEHGACAPRARRRNDGPAEARQGARGLRGACALQRKLHCVAARDVETQPPSRLADRRRRGFGAGAASGEVLQGLECQDPRDVRRQAGLRTCRRAIGFKRRGALRHAPRGALRRAPPSALDRALCPGLLLQRLQVQHMPGASEGVTLGSRPLTTG
mmetsp:Transcript_19233/g.57532  ORF Transcript_19233/g.57532 Transcript_19233/m.57532 type:complete len:296 (-) Transcript_19233:191-1078(-)